jgi:hypothetical protein
MPLRGRQFNELKQKLCSAGLGHLSDSFVQDKGRTVETVVENGGCCPAPIVAREKVTEGTPLTERWIGAIAIPVVEHDHCAVLKHLVTLERRKNLNG